MPRLPLHMIRYHQYVGGTLTRTEEYLYTDKKSISISCSWGCPNQCRYCNSGKANFYGNFRIVNVHKLVSDIRHYKKQHGIERFIFVDENLTGNPKHIKEMLRALNNLGIELCIWHLELDNMDSEILELYIQESKTKWFAFGIESSVTVY